MTAVAPEADMAGAEVNACKLTELADHKRALHPHGMRSITPAVLEQLPLSEVQRVTFYKRDELTTDLICCEVRAANRDWFFHEEAEGWELLLNHLSALPGFNADWFSTVAEPPFGRSETVAYLSP